MDLNAAKALNSRTWRLARVGVLVFFGLAGAILVYSLTKPAASRADVATVPAVQLSYAKVSPRP